MLKGNFLLNIIKEIIEKIILKKREKKETLKVIQNFVRN